MTIKNLFKLLDSPQIFFYSFYTFYVYREILLLELLKKKKNFALQPGFGNHELSKTENVFCELLQRDNARLLVKKIIRCFEDTFFW